MKTALQEVNEMFLKLMPEDFYSWVWNERDRLLELEKQQIIEAHGNKLKRSRDTGSYEYWFTGLDYYYKTFKKTEQ
jgi:hypothetical protein